MRRAAKVDANQPAIVAALRKMGCKVQSLAAIGKGVPDLLVMHRHRLVLMEIKEPSKVPSKRVLRPLQAKWHAEWDGAPIAVVETAEEAFAALGVAQLEIDLTLKELETA